MTSSLSVGFSTRPQRNYTLNRKCEKLCTGTPPLPALACGVWLLDGASRYPGPCLVGASEGPGFCGRVQSLGRANNDPPQGARSFGPTSSVIGRTMSRCQPKRCVA